MSVAYTLNGEPIAYPATVIALRAKRMKAKGAPELLYKDGVPLVLSPDGDIAAEVRDHLGDQFEDGELVRIKLEPIDERGRIVDDVPAAYVQFSAPRMYRALATAETSAGSPSGDLSIVQEAMRLNAAMAQTAMAKLPAIMEAAARILAAADGAGLPARTPVAPPENARNGVAEPAETDAEERPRNATADIMHGVSQVLASAEPIAKLATAWLGGRAATRNAASAGDITTANPPPAGPTASTPSVPAASPAVPPTSGPPKDLVSLMAHMEAVKALLTSEERAIAEAAAAEMSPDAMMHWAGKLGPLSVEDAAAEVRRMIGGAS